MQVPNTPAIWADFVHIRTVKGRKVCEIILETALEDLIEVLNRLGNPVGADSVPVAITRVDPNKVRAALDIKPQAKAQPSGSSKPFSSLPLSQQSAIRCGDVLFQEFMKADGAVDCADLVRAQCNIKSRSELDDGRLLLPRKYWGQLEAKYQSWLTDRKFAEAKR